MAIGMPHQNITAIGWCDQSFVRADCPGEQASLSAIRDYLQHPRRTPLSACDSWTGGHGTEPYEQNTQQSPDLGLNIAPHAAHSKK